MTNELMRILEKCKVIREQVELSLQRMNDSYDPNEFLNKDPLAPIIGTICDEKINADVAWDIPSSLHDWLKQQGLNFKASVICSIGKERLREWFTEYMKDKWPRMMKKEEREEWLKSIPAYIISSCEKIWKEYNDDPDSIFIINNGLLPIPLVYFMLRQFPGIGPKKASMIAREFGINREWFRSVKARLQKRGINLVITDIHFTEMPIDVHVRRVFQRLGFSRYSEPQDFQNLARIIYPKNPGCVDVFIWDLGRKICKENQPNCKECPLKTICEWNKKKENI
jgi:endonuclease III